MKKTFEESYHLEKVPTIPCDYECPRCAEGITHKKTKLPPSSINKASVMDWYICHKCEVSWVPNIIIKWNNRRKEERTRIRKLRVTIQESVAELNTLDADLETI
jgi:hypothetical protein